MATNCQKTAEISRLPVELNRVIKMTKQMRNYRVKQEQAGGGGGFVEKGKHD